MKDLVDVTHLSSMREYVQVELFKIGNVGSDPGGGWCSVQ